MIDAKWLELLKASGWQTFAIAVACGVYLYAVHMKLFPPLSEAYTSIIGFAGTICAMLSLTGFFSGALKFLAVRIRLVAFVREREESKDLIEYIPHLRPIEKTILGYLLLHNQQMFEGDVDGGHASTLISRGVIVQALRPGQTFAPNKCPYAIQNHHWKIMQKHRSMLVDGVDADEPYPWRVNRMSR